MTKRSCKKLLSCLLAFLLTVTPVLSGTLDVQVKAAQPTVWCNVTSGSGNGDDYTDASKGPASVLLHQNQTMPTGGTFSVTYEKLGTPSAAKLGFFYSYVDDGNWVYVGYNDTDQWYYEYKVDGSGEHEKIDLPEQNDGSRTTFSVSSNRETLVVNVNDAKKEITNQAFIQAADKAAGKGKFGFRAGSGTSFRFTDAKLNNADLSDEWSFLADNAGQSKTTETTALHTVSGTVLDQETNAPIKDATVRIGTESAKTADDGKFTIAVEAGTYDVAVSAIGYVANTVTGVAVSGDVNLTEAIKLTKRNVVTYDHYITSGTIQAAVSENFPQVYQYKVTVDGNERVVAGQADDLSVIKVNGSNITPVMDDVQINENSAVYSMTLKDEAVSIDMKMTVKISVLENDLTWEVTEIRKNGGCVKIGTIEVPNLNLVTITDEQSDAQFMGANVSGNVNVSGDEEITFEKGFSANATRGYAYGFLSADGVSAGVWSNSEMAGDRRLVRNNGTNSMSLTSAAWNYEYSTDNDVSTSRNYDGIPVSELPGVKVCLAGDENQDGITDWQDGAIAYRDIMNNPYGSENTKDLVNYRIVMNFSSQATNPFLKTADNIKKVYLATDGLPQAVMMKGFGSEGHDSANSEYGNVGERLGGIEDLKKLNTIAHQYNTQTGIHINAQEAYPEAQSFTDALINGPSSTGWGWLDQSYTINRTYDLGSGLRYKRLLQLYDQLNGTNLYANKWPGVAGQGNDETVASADVIAQTVAEHKGAAENLDFMYLDVWYGDSWETRKIAQQFNSLGWRFSTEFGYEGEYDSTWQHWATEGSYGGRGGKGFNSDVARFIRNHQKDSFVLNWPSYGGTADNPLLGGYDLAGFEGWGSNNNFDEYITRTFAVNLPTKFLQHYKVYKWENYADGESPVGNHEKQITLKSDDGKDTVVVTRNEEQRPEVSPTNYNFVERTITLNNKKILDDVTYLLPWTDSETNEEKLYHYNYDGGTTTWEVPDSWTNLANVKIYRLTDAGRTEGKTVAVSGGKVTLTAEADTPYVVIKGTANAAKKTVNDWSTYAHVKDTGFNGYAGTGSGDVLDGSVWSGDITDARVVRVASGNKYLRMGSENGKQTISTPITDLKAGTNYVAQVYVDNKSNAKAWIKVTGGEKSVSNYTLRSIAGNYPRCDAHNVNALSGSNMQLMLVSFTAKSPTATLILEREAGKGVTYFDDIRIIEKTLNNFKADGSFEQDFETVTGGLYPFVMGPAQGVDDQVTHLSEKNDPYTQSGWGNVILDDVIEGKWSLKYHRTNGGSGTEQGILYRTIPQNLRFESGETYEVSFDYQAGCSDSFYVVVGDGEQVVRQYEKFDGTAAPAAKQKSTTGKFTFGMTGSGSEQSWFGIATVNTSASGPYGQADFVLDNLKVRKVGAAIHPGSATVSSAKDPVEFTVSFDSELDNKNAVTWSSSDSSVARVVPDPEDSKKCRVYFVGFGDAEITAETTVNFEAVTLKGSVSFPEYYELDDKDKKEAKFKGAWANTEAEPDGDTAEMAIDGKAGTQWHSNYHAGFAASESNPAIITVELEDGDNISNYNRVTILQRNNNVNGLVQKYKCIVGDNYNQETHEITGNVSSTEIITAANSGQGEKERCVLPVGAQGKYLQIQVMQGYGNHASIAEINLDKVGSNNTEAESENINASAAKWSEDAKAALTAAISSAKAVYDKGRGDYSQESWTAFEAAYQAADAGKNGTDTNTLIGLHQTLANAQSGLVVTEAAARQKVTEELDKAGEIGTTNQGGYTAESWKAYTDAYQAASESGSVSDPAKIIRLQEALKYAMANLETEAQRAQRELKEALNAAAKIKEAGKGDYTAESWNAFTDAYNAAEKGQTLTDAEKLDELRIVLENTQYNFRTNLQEAKQRLGLALKAAGEKIGLGQGDYADASWNAYVSAYGNAFASLDTGRTDNLDALYAALMKAESELDTDAGVAQKALAGVLSAAASIKNAGQKNYTTESWNAFLAAYAAAEAGKNSNDPAQLLALQQALVAAQNGLTEAAPEGLQLKEYTDAKTGMKYKVTSVSKKTVKLVKAKDKATVNIPATVTFEGVSCKVTVIGSKAFNGCKKLKTVTIGNNVTTIEANAFFNCKKLTKVNVGKKLSKVNKNAFKKCTAKKITVKLPKNLKKNKKLKNQLTKAGIKKNKIK